MYGIEVEGYKRCKVMLYIIKNIRNLYLLMRKVFVFIICNINIF